MNPAPVPPPLRAGAGAAHRPLTPTLPSHLRHVLWSGDQLGAPVQHLCPTGFEALDAELPGGGWPQGGLTELLPTGSGHGELRLLAPALARLCEQGREVVWIQPPHTPYLPALQSLGLRSEHLLWIRTPRTDDAAWAADQALHSAGCGAVLWWTPESAPGHVGGPPLGTTLRRLHLAAQHSQACLWAIRPQRVRSQSSPAPLRLTLLSAPHTPGMVEVEVFKRRGPPCAQALHIDTRRLLAAALVHGLSQSSPPNFARRPQGPARRAPAPHANGSPTLERWLATALDASASR